MTKDVFSPCYERKIYYLSYFTYSNNAFDVADFPNNPTQ